jgi:microsomal dipeptidase-like Zn-dependent dipeptidase
MTRRVWPVLIVLVSVVAGFQLAPGGEPPAQASSPAEAQINATGFAFPDNTVDQPVQGFLQSHDHLWSYKGFGQGPFCGKTFDPGGITKAAVDCPEHNPLGIPAWFEQLASGQFPLTPHSTSGWPTFKDWPSASSATHNMSYYKGIERLWQSGVRMFVDDLVTNRGLCLIYTTKRAPCDEMTAIRTEAAEARKFEAWLDQQYGGPGKGWYRIVTDPAHARQVIADGKMAVVLGIETSEPFGCGRNLGKPRCTTADIDRGLDEVHALGVRSMFLCHKYDNALCGVRFDSGTNGVVVNAGNFITTGQFWQAETCKGPHHDNPIPPANAGVLATLIANSDIDLGGLTLPIYPPTPHCNKIGLSDLGEYAIKGMMKRGMILELDHMSVKAADRALTILEQHDYPGAISSHDWMDTGYNQRLQQLGGIITAIGQNSASFVSKWRQTRATADPSKPFAFGYGLDGNGLNSGMPKPGQNAAIQYPFTSYDGKVTLQKQVWGQRIWDFNSDGLAQQGMVPDWLESVRLQAGADGPAVVDSMTRGAEAYLQMWEGAQP